MNQKLVVRRSRLLSLVLRHRPDRAGLALGPGGWVAVDDLLVGLREHTGVTLTRAELDKIVAKNNKRRFAYDESGARIRASQGHSVEVDLELGRIEPPETLCHGTGAQRVAAIQREGLRRMRRLHVHLSADVATAHMVGVRHGVPAIFAVAAGLMARDGIAFFRADNGVWLTLKVPPRYLTLLTEV
ncbi:MAG TPA: RNA 2'-phosphotransferase [Ktedonobacterales bacterium]